MSKAAKKKVARKAKATTRKEKKKAHKSSTVPETAATTSTSATLATAKKGSASQPAISNEKIGGASSTRIRAEDRVCVIEENESIYAGSPRGTKSLVSAEALQHALIERFRFLWVTPRSCVVTASSFVWARFFSSKKRDWVLKKLVGFKYTHDGSIIVPKVVRYGKPKVGPKVSSYQVSKAVTFFTDILIELANHIIKNDKILPSSKIFELLCCKISVRSLIIKFAIPPSSLGCKVSLANWPVTHLINSKYIICKSVDYTLWDCPLPHTQVSTGYSLGPTLYEFKDGETWDPKISGRARRSTVRSSASPSKPAQRSIL